MKYLKFIGIGLVTLGLLYFAFRGQNLSETADSLSTAHLLPLLGGLLIMFLSHFVRAVRWRIILRPLNRNTSVWLAFKATIGGYAMNNLIPRSGELIRPYMLARREAIPMAGTLASVVVERLADVLALAGLILFSILSFRERVTSVFPMMSSSVLGALVVMLLLICSLIILFFNERRTKQMVTAVSKPLRRDWAEKIVKLALEFSSGLRGLEKSAILPLIVGTVGIWILYGISMYVSLQAFPETMAALTLKDAFLLLTLSGIAFTIPTPGATGSYHALISTGLSMIFGVPPTIALAYAIATHALSYLSVTILGLGFLAREGFSFSSAKSLESNEANSTFPPSIETPIPEHG